MKQQNDQIDKYMLDIFYHQQQRDQIYQQAIEFNQCVFTDKYSDQSDNIVQIIRVQERQTSNLFYYQKYDKSLTQYIKQKKKGRVSEQNCIRIIKDILKGLYVILQNGYRPIAIRSDCIVRYLSKNSLMKQQIWKIKNVVYSPKFSQHNSCFVTFQQAFAPPELYSRRFLKELEYNESDDYKNGLLVWSIGILFAKLLGIQNKLDSRKKLSQFKDKQFNILDILYIKNQYSRQFLNLISSMLHFDFKKRIKLKDIFSCQIFKDKIKQLSLKNKDSASQKLTVESQKQISDQSDKSDKSQNSQKNQNKLINQQFLNNQTFIQNIKQTFYKFQKVF